MRLERADNKSLTERDGPQRDDGVGGVEGPVVSGELGYEEQQNDSTKGTMRQHELGHVQRVSVGRNGALRRSDQPDSSTVREIFVQN